MRGFTLVEIQIALLVLVLLFSVMSGGIYLAGKTWRSGEALGERSADLITLSGLLRRQMAAAIPLIWSDPQGHRLIFSGTRDSITYVGHLPVHAVGGGPWLLRLYRNTRQELRLDYRPLDNAVFPLADGHTAWASVLLLQRVGKLSLTYWQGGTGTQGRWREHWDDTERMPAAIRLSLQVSDRPWPELVSRLPAHGASGIPAYVMRMAADAGTAAAAVVMPRTGGP